MRHSSTPSVFLEKVALQILFAMVFELLIQSIAKHALADQRSGSLHFQRRGKGHGRHRAADVLDADHLLLDLIDQLHPLQEGHLGLRVVDLHDDFHRHQRPELGLQPLVVVNDRCAGREQLGELDRRVDSVRPTPQKTITAKGRRRPRGSSSAPLAECCASGPAASMSSALG